MAEKMIEEDILIKIMGEYTQRTSRYVSCIRIDGKPILPPLINEEYRKELNHYKNLALLVEKKLKDQKLLCDNRQSIDSGIITNTTNEPSWLNNSVLPLENGATAFSGNNECTMNCENNVSLSDLSENASSKTLICDNDMWRYLSKCSENYDTSQIDLSDYDLSSDISQKFENHCNVTNGSVCKSLSRLSCNSTFKNESIEHSVDIYDIKSGDSVLEESNLQSCSVNTYNQINISQNRSLFEPYKCNKFCVREDQDNDYDRQNSENNICNNDANAGTFIVVENAIDDAERKTILCLSDGPSTLDPMQCNKINSDVINVNTDGCKLSDRDVTKLAIIGSEQRINSPKIEVKNNTCESVNQVTEHCQSNCLETSVEYPICYADGDKKIEKYNPLKYSSEGISTEMSYSSCDSNVYTSVLVAGDKDQKFSCEMEGLESDSTITDLCGFNATENSINLDYSSGSQKNSKEITFSKSISLSEIDIDYQACSVATVSQDTPEETSELCNEQSVSKNDDSDAPKLVRQNSYTLIAPSPILLAHAKASEKSEDGVLSEDDNFGSRKTKEGRKSWDVDKGKTDVGKRGKIVSAVPLKLAPDFNRPLSMVSPIDEVKSLKCKICSLPCSSVASPVKINPYFSSVDNLPMVNVRKFQEFISSKANLSQSTFQLPSELHPPRVIELNGQKELCNCTSFVDVYDDKNCNSVPADLVNSDFEDSEMLESKHKDLPTSKITQIIDNNVSNNSFINVEETYKSTSFNQSSSYILASCDTSNDVSSKNSDQNIQQCLLNSSGTISHKNDNLKNTEQVNSPLHNTFSSRLTFSSPGNTLQSVFLQMQNQHSQLMTQLLDRQKKEQEALANTFLNQQRQILREMRLIPDDSVELEHSCSNLDNESRSVSGSKTSHQLLSEIPSVEYISRDSHLFTNVDGLLPNGNSEKYQCYEKKKDSKYSTLSDECKKQIDCSALQQKCVSNYNEEYRKAATIINASVRGYLVRRLLKTEHVQEIIKTISESVMCALQLQRECPVDITPSDVELHRRLIQQLTAACHSLHETFFSLTMQEKMAIIASDREKRQSQVIRPVSARSTITAATQKYLQRKQLQRSSSRQLERPVSTTRRSWWRCKGRVSSAGEAPSWLPQQYLACPLSSPTEVIFR